MTDNEWLQLQPFAEALQKAEDSYAEWQLTVIPQALRGRIESKIQGDNLQMKLYAATAAFNDKKRKLGLAT